MPGGGGMRNAESQGTSGHLSETGPARWTGVRNGSLESRMPRKCASPVRRGAVGNLRQPVALVVRHRESQQGAGRLPYFSHRLAKPCRIPKGATRYPAHAHTPAPLLTGPYTPPPLRRGDRATCLFRDALVVITSWSSAPIPWPRCCRPGTHGGGSGLLVTEELVRAIRPESAVAVCYWWGVVRHEAWQWNEGKEGRGPPVPPPPGQGGD